MKGYYMELEANMRLGKHSWAFGLRYGHLFHMFHVIIYWLPKNFKASYDRIGRTMTLSCWLFSMFIILPKKV